MAQGATETEILIKETAKKVFFSKGCINASTTEIAAEAGVNRALIHYYFRSRDILFNTVLEEALRSFTGRMSAILGSEASLRTKIKSFLDAFIEDKIDYPYLETFIVTELAKNPEKIKELKPQKDNTHMIMDTQIKAEIAAGRLQPITTEHFITNLMSMCNYPLAAKPIIQSVFGFDEAAYRDFLMERKQVVYRALFNEAYPES